MILSPRQSQLQYLHLDYLSVQSELLEISYSMVRSPRVITRGLPNEPPLLDLRGYASSPPSQSVLYDVYNISK